MKRTNFYSWATPLLLSLVAFNACTKSALRIDNLVTPTEKSSKLSSKAGGIAVTGGGTTIEENKKSTFTFHAQNDGSVTKGNLTYQFRAGGFKIKGDVTGLTTTGNTAKITGKITDVNGVVPTDYQYVKVGKDFYFIVQDGGQGQGVDKVSDFVVYVNSTTVTTAPYLTVSGNIDIK